MKTRLLAAALLLAACDPADRSAPLETSAPEQHPPKADDLVVHEWGTYTSVQGSDGRSQPGLHHTEELLPEFVHARDSRIRADKGAGLLPELVTQKLETPVIYFHGALGAEVAVDV